MSLYVDLPNGFEPNDFPMGEKIDSDIKTTPIRVQMKSSFSVTRNLIIEITPARFNRS